MPTNPIGCWQDRFSHIRTNRKLFRTVYMLNVLFAFVYAKTSSLFVHILYVPPSQEVGLCQLQTGRNQTQTILGRWPDSKGFKMFPPSLPHQVALSSYEGSGTGASLLGGGVIQEIKHLEGARDQQRTDKKYSVYPRMRIQT